MKHFESDFTARAGLRLLLIIFLVMGINSCNRTNPFFSEWDTPYGIPPFEKIQEKDYIEAIEAGIHRQSAEIDAILAKVKQMYADQQVNDIDGVKIDFPDKWVHLRKSNTEPIIRVYSEAATMEAADALGKQIMDVVKTFM